MAVSIIHSRIDPNVKAAAMHVFEDMGLTLSEAIRLFLIQSIAEKRIPFSINVPNAKTKAALLEAKHGKLHKTSLKQLKADWEAACAK